MKKPWQSKKNTNIVIFSPTSVEDIKEDWGNVNFRIRYPIYVSDQDLYIYILKDIYINPARYGGSRLYQYNKDDFPF